MYTMVLMMAVGGSADATAFGGRKASCHGGGYAPAYTSCTGSGYMPSYAGCSGSGYDGGYGGCTGSGYVASSGCHGSSKGGFLSRLCGKKSSSCHGGAYTGCTGYVAAPVCCPAPVAPCGCYGSSMVSSPVMMGGPVMAAPCMTPGMAPLGMMPAVTNPTPMPAPGMTPAVTPDKMPGATPAVTPEKPAPTTPPGTKI